MKPLVYALLCAFAAGAAAEEALKFSITQYQIEGNSVLPDERIQSALAPYTGDGRDFADVQRALEALEALYRKAGYGALQVYLPEQELNKGVVTFKVVEPKVGKVRIEGNQYFGADNIRHALPALREGEVPNTVSIADDMHLANENPSRHMTATLQASDDPQKVDVNVKVEDEKDWRVFASVDNSGTSDGRGRASLGYQNANMFDRDQLLTAQASTSTEDPSKVTIFGAGYKIPLYGLGDSLSFYGGYSNVASGSLSGVENFNVSGKGDIGGVRYAQRLPSVGDYQQSLQWGDDWRKFDTNTTFGTVGSGAAPTSLPPSQYIVRPVSLGYVGQWQGLRWSYDWNASISHNVSGGNLAAAAPRVDAANDYTIVRYGGEIYVTLPADWTAHLALNGQATNDALPPGEQYGIGGANSVRGYEERAISDDSGQTVNLEGYTPELAGAFGWSNVSLRGLVFGDYGRVMRNDAQPGEQTGAQLEGAGAGVRLGIGKAASVKMDVACALKDGGGAKEGDVRVHVVATVSY